MKRISPFLPIFLILIGLLHTGFAMDQREGEPDVLRRNGPYLLTRTDLNTYQAVVAFVIDRDLNSSEKAEIKQIVLEGFETDPKAVQTELRSLNWALSEIDKLESVEKRGEIRLGFQQQLIAYQAKGEVNALVNLILVNF